VSAGSPEVIGRQVRSFFMHAVISSFTDLEQAETAVAALSEAGFSEDEIGILLRGYLVQEQMRQADEALTGAGYGAAAGTAVGGLLGLALGAASVSVPLVGPILAGGIVAATLGGAATGAVYGTLLGLVFKLGLADEDARFYTETLANNGVVVVVEAHGERAATAWRVMHEAQATRIHTTIVGPSQDTSITMPMIGLFPNPKDANRVMNQLIEEGIEPEEIYLVDGMNIKERLLPNGRFVTPFAASPLGIGPVPILPVATNAPGRSTAESHLTNLGIDAADAPFYVDAVQQGGALLIVTTEDKQEAKISRQVMKKMDVTQMTTAA
jgi:hypothetical protein